MAVLHIRLGRESFWIGWSTSYKRDARGLLGALLSMAVGMRRDSGEPRECLVGRVQRPTPARLQALVKGSATPWSGTEILGRGHDQVVELVDVGSGQETRLEALPEDELTVVLEGRGALRSGADVHALEPGVVAALPAGAPRSFTALDEGSLRLLVCRLP